MTIRTRSRPDVMGGKSSHQDRGLAARWGRIRLARLAPAALLMCLMALLWPASLGGPFGLVIVGGHSMEPTYQLGDLVITWKKQVAMGDVVLYRIPEGQPGGGNPVIHRVIGGDSSGWRTQGDNMAFPDAWNPAETDVMGVATWHLPLDVRVIGMMRSWWFVAVSGGLAVALLLWPSDELQGEQRADPDQ